MNNSEVIAAYESLKKVAEEDVVFSIVFLHARQKNLRAFEPIVKDFEGLKDELIRKYGSEDESGQIMVQTSDPNFMNEFNELLNCENDISISKVPISALPSELSAKVFDMISFMVEDEEEEKASE